ncbi:MAG: bifunctional glycosyltransferase family 2/GtrA family protein [Actinomyces sp. oral taxon 181]|uniref:bifunctional glycosyltransferase family 2/GtrA family protein n=1 Tax=Actinomyces sp. oral taxon 181 TaxID=712121 RepID=UPI0025C20DA5|nr:bifunctional glycosyltransferase family 2/GtrA family protein [Actinomyces sp. oral taxon 181]MBS4795839.1 bifunctional glycosyltransferase family 2/GtrA family protein [Actinomyces sp. oral taxon 181]
MYVLIPAYQPDARLPRLILELHRADPSSKIVVVDDGSGQKFSDIFEASATAGAHVISYEHNRGKGYALREGFTWIRDVAGDSRECVVTADADGQHTLNDIFRVGRTCTDTGKSVLGVREFVGHVPARSRIGNTATSALFWLATGWKLKDTQTGLRAFPVALLPELLEVQGDRYEYELRVLLHLAKFRHPVTQIPIETIYEAGNPTSHFRPLQDSARIWAPLLKFAASSGVATVIDYVLVLVLNALTGALFFPVVAARMVSASVNFAMNRRVFEATGVPLRRSALRYAALAVAVIAGSYTILAVLTGIGMPLWIAKIIADTTMYLVSYSAQSRYVFAPAQDQSAKVARHESQTQADSAAQSQAKELEVTVAGAASAQPSKQAGNTPVKPVLPAPAAPSISTIRSLNHAA